MKTLLLTIVAILFAINAYAQPSTVTYQGVLTDNSGVLINDTPNIIFALYDASMNGNQLWTETKTGVSVTNGLFQVELGSGTSFGTLNFSQNLWLQITVGATVLTPRIAFTAGGYSLAGKATSLQIATDAGAGKVLTSDANGNGSWQATATGTSTGDMQYWNGTAWVTVPAGTTGQLLSVNASGVPQWQNPSSLKSAATQAPTMTSAGVTFNGVVNPNDYSTTVAFEYSTSTAYGTTVVATQSPVTGTTNTAVTSAMITTLTVGTTYHVRMVTQSIFGTFYGDDITFTYLYYGASYAGGLVFSIDNSGQHGLVAATVDQGASANYWAGAFNACTGNINGYTDWYLPSKSTLNLMYVNLHTQGLGGFASGSPTYWSSTESTNNSFAWSQAFYNGSQSSVEKYSGFRVRAVRAF